MPFIETNFHLLKQTLAYFAYQHSCNEMLSWMIEKLDGKSLSKWQSLQCCKYVMPKFVFQRITYTVRFTFSGHKLKNSIARRKPSTPTTGKPTQNQEDINK
jgi:hypothetical protein